MNAIQLLRTPSRLAFVAAALLGAARSQCTPVWRAAGSPEGADAEVRAATMWDPDGAGPAAARVVVGGNFSYVATAASARLAAWDFATDTWSPLGPVIGTNVTAMTVLANGELVITGVFSGVGGVAADGLAWSDGTQWAPIPGGRAECLLALPNGDLVAARNSLSGGQWQGSIGRWNGSAWSPFTAGVDGRITAMTRLPNGDLVAAGSFASAGGVPANNIARWNGSTWAPLGSGFGGQFPNEASALAVLANGDLVAGGYFTLADGLPAQRIARWNGTAWAPLGSGVTGPQYDQVATLQVLTNGDLIVGGYFNTAGGIIANCVARWAGGTWSAVGVGFDSTPKAVVELPNGELFAGGFFQAIASGQAHYVARWDGTEWRTLGGTNMTNGVLTCSASSANGDLVVGGVFTNLAGIHANRIARRSGGAWTALGSGINGPVYAVEGMPNGDIIAAGTFSQAGGGAANNIARWNGTSWSPLGSGTSNPVTALATMPNGDLIAGGSFTTAGGQPANCVARWNGSAWSALGSSPPNPVTALAVRPDGMLAVAATLGYQGRIELWDGTAWSNLLTQIGVLVRTTQWQTNGDLLVGGSFHNILGVPISGLARWNGSAWSAMQLGANSSVLTLARLPDGDLVAGGAMSIGGTLRHVARWDGGSWTPLADFGVGNVNTLAVSPHGEIAVGGSFQTIGGVASPNLALLAATCPATAVPFGSGCVGSSGTNQLVATSLPWLGSSYRGRATGMPPNSFVAVISGFTPLAIPLSLFLSEALPGCLGYVSGDVLTIALPLSGEVTSQVAIPDQMALVGLQFHQYVVPFEFGGGGTLVSVTSSNALTMTVGHL
jgi:trimeric autotransporter adhesin